MSLVKVCEDTYLNPSEVVAVVRDTTYKYESPSPSDTNMIKDFDGSRIVLKCGRKVFVNGVFPDEILEKLSFATKESEETK